MLLAIKINAKQIKVLPFIKIRAYVPPTESTLLVCFHRNEAGHETYKKLGIGSLRKMFFFSFFQFLLCFFYLTTFLDFMAKKWIESVISSHFRPQLL